MAKLWSLSLALLLAAAGSEAHFGLGARRGRGLRQTDDDDDVGPAPASIGADVPLTYFGPAPSMVQRELIGPFQLLKSGEVNEEAGTITLPIYKGIVDGPFDRCKGKEAILYVVMDTTDEGNAKALGLNHSPKLSYANVGRGTRRAYLCPNDNLVHFARGRVDFTPVRSVTPGEDSPFPPSAVQPGSVGDRFYSPLFNLKNARNEVYNGPTIANITPENLEAMEGWCDGIPEDELEYARTILHDRVSAICVADGGMGGTATIDLSPGFSFARPVLYASMDASSDVAAALEAVTLAPGLNSIRVGGDDSLFSAVERIFITINGHTNQDINAANITGGPGETSHPLRQGLNSAIMGEGSPLNVLGGIPTIATDYSPLWDANFGMWTEYAVQNNYRTRLLEEFQILGFVEQGFVTGPGGSDYGSSGVIINCPIVFRFL